MGLFLAMGGVIWVLLEMYVFCYLDVFLDQVVENMVPVSCCGWGDLDICSELLLRCVSRPGCRRHGASFLLWLG